MAAFLAFHRRAARKSAGGYARAFLSGGGWAFAGLALLGFAGGLFLARVSVSPPDRFITVAAHPPEMLYAKPGASKREFTPAVVNGSASDVEETSAIGPTPPALADAENSGTKRSDAFRDEVNADSEMIAITSTLGAPLPDATANLAAAMRLGAITAAQSHGHNGADVTVTYDAVELPTVPEPANGSIVAVAVGGLIGLSRLTKTLRHSRR